MEQAKAADCKFVVVLNGRYELPRLASGMGHVTAGLVGSQRDQIAEMRFLEYVSADGDTYPFISDCSFIVLKGRGGQLRTLRKQLQEEHLPCVAYLDTMLEGGTDVEMAATKALQSEDLKILALGTFGDAAQLTRLTKKFSLWT